jgi:sugar phosphate isomerase/epimerase
MPTISIQLYTLREALEADRTGTLAAVAAMGVDEVEPFGIENFDWLPAALAEAGLKAGSAHAGIVQRPADVLAAAKTLGVSTVFQPSPDPRNAFESAEDLASFAAALNAQVDAFAAEGIRIGYHNHDWEFTAPKIDGQSPYDYFVSLLDPRVVLELDTYWVAAGGIDPLSLFEKYGERITHVHVKDGPVEGGHGVANVVLGTGAMDVPTILSASPNRIWVLEFDRAAINPIDESAQSIAYLRSHL